MSKKSIIILLTAVIFMLTFNINVGAEENLKIYTSFYPLKEAAENIGGNRINIESVVPSGAEIHGYEPSPRQIAALEKADIFYYIGIGLEPWTERVVNNLKNSQVKTVQVSEDLTLRKVTGDENEDHHHNHEDSEREFDPHIWLDPVNMKEIGKKIKDTLSEIDPANSNYYEDNYHQFAEKLEELDKEYKDTLVSSEKDTIMVSHAVFGYLADRYNFKQLAVTGITPHEEPSPRTIADMVDTAREYNLEYIFMETLASPGSVEVLAEEADLEILTLHPVSGLTEAQKESGEDYFSLMRKNLDNLQKALGD